MDLNESSNGNLKRIKIRTNNKHVIDNSPKCPKVSTEFLFYCIPSHLLPTILNWFRVLKKSQLKKNIPVT